MSGYLGPIDKLESFVRKTQYRLALLPSYYSVSERQLERYFLSDLRVPPKTWIMQLRIKDSLNLLASGIQVKEVAARLGYSNATHFTRAFKQVMGTPPLKFLQEACRLTSTLKQP